MRETTESFAISMRGYGGESEKAIADFLEALRLSPTFAEAFNNLAGMHADTGRYKDALFTVSKAISLMPQDATVLRNRGWLFAVLKQYSNALDDLNRSLGIQPNKTITLVIRAFVHIRLNDREQALGDISRAQHHNPNGRELSLIGVIYSSLSMHAEALDFAQRGLEISDRKDISHCDLGFVLLNKGDFDPAIETYEKGTQLWQETPRHPLDILDWQIQILEDLANEKPHLKSTSARIRLMLRETRGRVQRGIPLPEAKTTVGASAQVIDFAKAKQERLGKRKRRK